MPDPPPFPDDFALVYAGPFVGILLFGLALSFALMGSRGWFWIAAVMSCLADGAICVVLGAPHVGESYAWFFDVPFYGLLLKLFTMALYLMFKRRRHTPPREELAASSVPE